MKIGFIGLGIMGKPMAKNLLAAGHEVVVYTHKQATIDELAAAGAEAGTSGADLASRCEAVITMLPNSPNVRDAVLGRNGVLEGAKEGLVLIDMSSIDPVESRKIAEECEKKGVSMLDAPVSGGEPMAIAGTLSIMAGGRKEDFDRFEDVLKAMGSSVVYVGPIGSGNVAKLANQMIVAVNIAACAEAFTFAAKMGTDPSLVFEAIKGGLAGSNVMNAKVPMMIEGNYKPGFRVALHTKDLTNALNASHAIHAPAPFTAQAMEIFQYLNAHDCGADDHDAMVKYYEELSGTTVRK
ncbi:MAG: 2-hydroxy-3-oxopropionate reductase [Lachnospiraceae bacterium]|nr:2-hydroxy-3-oxopropionate reductase [Lachnospiraceae bacterium]